MADCAGLENQCGCKLTEGSNPSLSVPYEAAIVTRWRLFCCGSIACLLVIRLRLIHAKGRGGLSRS